MRKLIRKLGGTRFLTAVLIITVTGVDAEPPGVTGFGEMEQEAPLGNPPQANVIGWVNPFIGLT